MCLWSGHREIGPSLVSSVCWGLWGREGVVGVSSFFCSASDGTLCPHPLLSCQVSNEEPLVALTFLKLFSDLGFTADLHPGSQRGARNTVRITPTFNYSQQPVLLPCHSTLSPVPSQRCFRHAGLSIRGPGASFLFLPCEKPACSRAAEISRLPKVVET